MKVGRKAGTKVNVSEERLNNKVRCLVCRKVQKNHLALSKHLLHQHKLESKEYYDRIVKKFREGRCKICGKETRWVNIREGYMKICSRKCSLVFASSPKYHEKSVLKDFDKTKLSKSGCLICGADFENNQKLTIHLKLNHGFLAKDYYNKFFKVPNDEKCRICGNETKFFTLLIGYNHTCSKSCRKIYLTKIRNEKDYVENMSCVQTGHILADETKEKIGKKVKKFHKEWKERDPTAYGKWLNESVKRMLAKVCERPNKFEQNCFKALEAEWPGKFKYVGDGSVLINYRSPDFINEVDKVIVLCHGIYWHLLRYKIENTSVNKKLMEKKDSKPFEKAGYTVIVLWEDEL